MSQGGSVLWWVEESNLLKNRFSLFARSWPADAGLLPLSLVWPEIIFRPFHTSLTLFPWSCSSSLLLYLSLPLLIAHLSSHWTLFSSSLSPGLKTLFYSFNRLFSSGVTQGLLLEKHRILRVGTVFSTQKFM